MKKIILIISLIAIGIGYAGVLNYYGKIVGTVNVQAPIFYAHSEEEYGYYLFKPNIPPDGSLKKEAGGVYNSRAGEYDTQINSGWLFPQVSSWYPSKWTFYYETKIENANSAKLYAKIYKFDTNTNSKTLVTECPTSDPITSTSYVTITSTCNVPSINLSSSERILVEIWAKVNINADTVGKVYLKIDDPSSTNPTRIEIST